MRIERGETTDGRTVLKVWYERTYEPETALNPVIISTWQVHVPKDYDILNGQHLIEYLGSVREDDLTPIKMTEEEREEIIMGVTREVADYDPDWKV